MNKEELHKQLQQQLDEAKEKTKIQLTDLEIAIQNAKNNISKLKEDPIQKQLRIQKENNEKRSRRLR